MKKNGLTPSKCHWGPGSIFKKDRNWKPHDNTPLKNNFLKLMVFKNGISVTLNHPIPKTINCLGTEW